MFIELFAAPVGRDHRARRNPRTTLRSRRGRIHSARSTTPNSTIHRSYGTNLQLCSTAWGLTFLCRQESQQRSRLGEALRLFLYQISVSFLRSPEQKPPSPSPLPARCAKSLYCIRRFDKQFDKFLFDLLRTGFIIILNGHFLAPLC